ncbi:hypothetical protein CAPTEDRAFT_195695 [Capitella teleta]|uniref:Sushi domain-containing protein n=1 Tax=Capitella teleta TaxID=283909 RepID=X1ZVE3_CAPTE|nr:hypothetical protein CAPTEDRAFT_195695 [Capitella teleta]|eukprot:ELT88408.1 hypothetical protein CAPTEDRAFT_195695 [Capitella teleta]
MAANARVVGVLKTSGHVLRPQMLSSKVYIMLTQTSIKFKEYLVAPCGTMCVGYIALSVVFVEVVCGQYNSTTGEEVCSPSLTCLNRGRCNGERCQCLAGFSGVNCGIEVTCPALSSLVQHVVLPSGYSASFGALVTYGCIPGYQFPDVEDPGLIYTRMVRCNADGKWGPNLKGCLALCPPVPIWRGYHVSSLDRYSGTSVLYNCSGVFPAWKERVDKGYVVVTSSSADSVHSKVAFIWMVVVLLSLRSQL